MESNTMFSCMWHTMSSIHSFPPNLKLIHVSVCTDCLLFFVRWTSNVMCYAYSTVCSSIPLLIGICNVSMFLLLWMNIFTHFFIRNFIHIFLGRHAFTFSRSNSFPNWMNKFTYLLASMRIHWLCTISCFNFSYFSKLNWHLTVVLICSSLKRNNVEYFSYAHWPFESYFWSACSFLHFKEIRLSLI